MKRFDPALIEKFGKMGTTNIAVYLAKLVNPNSSIKAISDCLNLAYHTVVKSCGTLKSSGFLDVDNRAVEDLESLVVATPKDPEGISSSKMAESFAMICEIILTHERYKYARKPMMTRLIREKIINLHKHNINDKITIRDYCFWWIENKINLSFNFGLFCCDLMIKEYQMSKEIAADKTVAATKLKRTQSKFQSKATSLELELIKGILRKIINRQKLSPEDNELLADAVRGGVISKRGSKYILGTSNE